MKPSDIPQDYVPQGDASPNPTSDIDLQFDWTQPKSKQVSKKNARDGFSELINQDIVTSFYTDKGEQIANDHIQLSNNAIEFSNANRISLAHYQRFLSRFVGGRANTAKGRDGNLLKIMKTNYKVEEIKKNYDDAEDLKKKEVDQNQQLLTAHQRRGFF